MRILDLIWDNENLQHVVAHGVEPDEVEDVCFGKNRIERVGGNKHAILGQTAEGRYLLIIIAHSGQGIFRVVTARDMINNERRRYAKWK